MARKLPVVERRTSRDGKRSWDHPPGGGRRVWVRLPDGETRHMKVRTFERLLEAHTREQQ